MIQDKTLVKNFTSLLALVADLIRLHANLAEVVANIDAVPKSERDSIKRGVKKSRELLSKMQAYLADLPQ